MTHRLYIESKNDITGLQWQDEAGACASAGRKLAEIDGKPCAAQVGAGPSALQDFSDGKNVVKDIREGALKWDT